MTTDASETYRIAMILHPRYKLQYFHNRRWETDWIEIAEEILRDEYKCLYGSLQVDDSANATSSGFDPGPGPSTSSGMHEPNMFDEPPPADPGAHSLVNDDSASEIDHYLVRDVDSKCVDALAWWATPENKCRYPRLSRMALDYLSIPATSVEVERVFSRGRILISHLRNRLAPQTIRSLLCLNYWSKGGLVQDKDILFIARSNPEVEDDGDVEFEDGWDAV
ncbi:hypothetical protein D9611_013421 [Ephemerocybe angulata]|uniref:HAT C-terminal dimerisation domain-containing protein n=1 Tax=Ephemerocybe angulata TaxID=980116 RepID=A0A8H5BUK6_9AGAR|nr:hypothetical protein D9611_013421 [Tulosesus angulatus]